MRIETLEKPAQVDAEALGDDRVYIHPWYQHPQSDELLEAVQRLKMAGFLEKKNGVLCLTELGV